MDTLPWAPTVPDIKRTGFVSPPFLPNDPSPRPALTSAPPAASATHPTVTTTRLSARTRIESKPKHIMPRSAATYGRVWSGRRKAASSSSYSDEDRAARDYDFFGSSDLSEPETEPEYTPETEDDAFDKSGPRDYRFEVSLPKPSVVIGCTCDLIPPGADNSFVFILAASRDGLGEAQRVLRVVPRNRAQDPGASVAGQRLGQETRDVVFGHLPPPSHKHARYLLVDRGEHPARHTTGARSRAPGFLMRRAGGFGSLSRLDCCCSALSRFGVLSFFGLGPDYLFVVL
ncbi:hypothetical protein V8D89_004031 [Ganoderma adspersum]